MMKIEATIQTFQLEAMEDLLETMGVGGITISEVRDHNGAGARKAFYRGAEYQFDVPRLKLEMLVPAERVSEVSEAIAKLAGAPFTDGDNTVLAYDVGTPIHSRASGAILRSR